MGGPGYEAVINKIKEYTNGHVTVTMAYANSITSITESYLGLQDGRLDWSNVDTFLIPAEFPLTATLGHEMVVLRGPSPVADTLSSYGALIQTAWETEEFSEEFAAQELRLLQPIDPNAQNILACQEPATTLAELAGKQIRVGSLIQAAQVEALGGVPVTVAFPDLFESLQRGIVDCLIIGGGSLVSFPGMTALAPYIINPQSSAFGMNMDSWAVNATRWAELPLVLQQLVFDLNAERSVRAFETHPETNQLLADGVAEGGGAFLDLAEDADTALLELNESTVAAWSELTEVDGADFEERLRANLASWHERVLEAGYSDAPFSDIDNMTAPLDVDAFAAMFYESIVVPNRPS